MAQIIRTERSSVLWAPETTFGTFTTPGLRFGIHETVTVPDIEPEMNGFFGIGSLSRNRDTMLAGKLSLKGSLPDIMLQANFNTALLMGSIIGKTVASGPSQYVISDGIGVTDQRNGSITMQVAYRDTSQSAVLVRNHMGGKINRATISADEGKELTLSIEDIMFLYQTHNRIGVFGYDPSVIANTDPGISSASRFLFAGGSIIGFGQVLARVRKFTLTIDNQMEYKYYIKTSTYDPQVIQYPNDIVEGKRVYKLELEVDLGDPVTDLVFFDYLRLLGKPNMSSRMLGVGITLGFAAPPSEIGNGLGGASFSIQCSPTATTSHPGSVITGAKHNIPSPPAGLIPVTISMDVDAVVMNALVDAY